LPVTRLHPLTFPEPDRFIGFLEEDPALIEPGLRIVARRLPLSGAGGAVVIDLLAIDRDSRIVLIDVKARLSVLALETAAAAREWISKNLATLRVLCPPLTSAADATRAILIGGRVEPALESLLEQASLPGTEVYAASAFRTPDGTGLSLRRAGRVHADRDARDGTLPGIGESTGAAPRSARAGSLAPDPLSGIPISAEETAEFRRLVAVRRVRGISGAGGRAASHPLAREFQPVVEN
jgi:hypothetical protein